MIRFWGRALLLGALAVIAVLTALLAVRAVGYPLAGALLDPDATISGYGPVQSQIVEHDLQNPDHVVQVTLEDGSRSWLLDGKHGYRGDVWDEALRVAEQQGQATLIARIQTGERVVTLSITRTRLSAGEWALFALAPWFAGILLILVAAACITAAVSTQQTRSCAWFSVTWAGLLLTLFDYHTTRSLSFVFEFCFGAIPFAQLRLALALPLESRWRVWSARAFTTIDLLALFGGISMGLARSVWNETWTIGVVVSQLLALGSLALGASYCMSLMREPRASRVARVMLGLGLGVVPLLAALAAATLVVPQGVLWERRAMSVALPLASLTPAAALLVHVRHDLWRTRSTLSRTLAQGCTVALTTGLAFSGSVLLAVACGLSLADAVRSVGLGSACALGIAFLWVSLARDYPSLCAGRNNHCVERLSAELLDVAEPTRVAACVRNVLRLVLIADIRINPPATGNARGNAAPASHPTPSRWLPLLWQGARLGEIHVRPASGRSRLTDSECRLLESVSFQVALALAHCRAYEELEAVSRQQVEAWKVERVRVVEGVASQIAQTLRPHADFFRGWFSKALREPANVSTGSLLDVRAQLSALEALVRHLARIANTSLAIRSIDARELLESATGLVKDTLGATRMSVELRGPLSFNADADAMLHLMLNLLLNAIDAAADTDAPEVHLSWHAGASGARLVVADNGPGFDAHSNSPFAPWLSRTEGQHGVGLRVVQRIASKHGFRIRASRVFGWTRLVVQIGPEALPQPTDRCRERTMLEAARGC